MDINDFYSDLLIEYSRDESYRRELPDANYSAEMANPLCGDKVKLFLKVEDEKVQDVSYLGNGCAISQASAGILCSLVKDLSFSEVENLIENFNAMILQGQDDTENLGDAKILAGVAKLPGRHRCALMSWENLKQGIAS